MASIVGSIREFAKYHLSTQGVTTREWIAPSA
jgi:hypothetical protein